MQNNTDGIEMWFWAYFVYCIGFFRFTGKHNRTERDPPVPPTTTIGASYRSLGLGPVPWESRACDPKRRKLTYLKESLDDAEGYEEVVAHVSCPRSEDGQDSSAQNSSAEQVLPADLVGQPAWEAGTRMNAALKMRAVGKAAEAQ